MHMLIVAGSTLLSGATAAGSAIAGAGASLGSALGITGAASGASAAAGAGSALSGVAAHAGATSSAAAISQVAAAGSGGTNILALLQGGANTLGAFSTFVGGLAQKRAFDQAAIDEQQAADQERIIGLQEGNDILDEAVSTLARQRIVLGASGVDAFSGTADRVIRRGVSDTERDVRLTGDNATIRALQRRRVARSLRRRGRGALISSIGASAAQGVDAFAKFKEVA